MGSKFTYKKRTAADVEKRARQYQGNFDSFISADYPLLKVKEGEITLRIMRRTWADEDCEGKNYGDGFDLPVQIHFQVGPDNATYLCNDKMRGLPCPVCDARREAEDEEEAKKMAPNKRSICWVIDRNNEKVGPQVWSVPASLMREIINRTVVKKTGEVIEVDDWDNGYDVTFVREGNDQRTKYTQVEFSRDATPLNDNPKTQKRWITYVEDHPLPDVLNFYDEEYIEKVLKGKKAKPSRNDEDDEDERPRKTASKRPREEEEEDEDERRVSRAKAKREEPEEDEEDEDDRRSSRAKAKREPEEDEDPPFDDDDAPRSKAKNGKRVVEEEEPEEDEAPKKRSARPSKAAEEDEAGEEDGEDETPSQQARKGLDRLKSRGAERR